MHTIDEPSNRGAEVTSIRARVARTLLSRKEHRQYLVMFTCLAVVVALFVVAALTEGGIALTHEDQVLDCPYAGNGAHTHDDGCYDVDGNLVCPLEERELHVHDDSCYEETSYLACGQEESEGHAHTDACYDEDGNLACGQEESEGHVHTDDCWEATRELVCGLEEVTEEHVHGPGCFVAVTEDDGEGQDTPDDQDDADLDPTDQGSDDQLGETDGEGRLTGEGDGSDEDLPAQRFEHTFVNDKNEQQLKVFVDAPEGALPEGTTMKAKLLSPKKVDRSLVQDAVTERSGGRVLAFQAVDITFRDADRHEVEPRADVTVTLTSDLVDTHDEAMVVHVESDAEAQRRAQAEGATTYQPEADVVDPLTDRELDRRDMSLANDQLAFDTDAFSMYVLATTSLDHTMSCDDGDATLVTVGAPAEAGVSQDAELQVSAIGQDSAEYEDYLAQVTAALGLDPAVLAEDPACVRLLDISIVDSGKKVEIAAPVDVSIQLAGTDLQTDAQVLHFVDGEATPDVLSDVSVAGDTVSFEAGGFSVYAVVDAPEPVAPSGWNKLSSVDEIAQQGGMGLYVRSYGGFFFMDETYNVSDTRTGIRKTRPAASNASAAEGAVKYYFELVEGTSNQFHAYCLVGNTKMYVRQSGNSLTLTEGLQPDTSSATSTFTIEPFPNNANTFRMKGVGGYYWNMQGGDSGNGFCAYNSATDTNARIQLEFHSEQPDDPYGLDGKSFGIAYNDESTIAAALMAEEKTVGSAQRLAGQDMLIRENVLGNDGVLLVSEDSDITLWTFENVQEDTYYISADVDGETKYLAINGANVTLVSSRDEATPITAKPGTQENAGKWHFTANGRSLNLFYNVSNGTISGFGAATGNGATTWMNLVEVSVLNDDDFTRYTARKVSVSDTANVHDGQQVVIYTRVWNDTTKRYEFYAVDHDGTLIHCYDTGDNVEWVGSQVNTALWDFTEYLNTDNTPSYFYELSNTQYGSYIAPQASDGKVLSDSPIGINMSGRRHGENSTTIIAWDDGSYAYSGLKVENGRVIACPLAEADDFYFAVIDPVEEDELTTVDTVDNSLYGITMKMIDFDNGNINTLDSPRDAVQNPFFGGDQDRAGLLSTNLTNGYPTTTAATGENAGHSLSELYSDMTDVNHLLIQSTYNESGYFEYDSTQNFAHLNDDGTFTVYNQIGSISDYNRPTGTHGQFMPYDDLTPGVYTSFTNQTDVLQHELPDTDPRKGERLYNIGSRRKVHYNFGMEMEASFTQTANGLDAWGHDIIFEFSGDDDFWLYVDDELVLDLGGVHSAMAGSVNFRTGEVKGRGGSSTTLYEVFRENYQGRDMTDAQIEEKLSEIFELNEDGNYVFRDYTTHTMRMFYMERGAGASNLHMRFNLAAVRPGTFLLSKELSGTDNASNNLIELPYQIYYHTQGPDGPVEHQLGSEPGQTEKVHYAGTNRAVRYSRRYTPAGGSSAYSHVFFLKPGESAEVELPEGALDYYVVECGVNPDIYDVVSVNGDALTGTDTQNPVGSSTVRQDFATTADTTENRPIADFDNHVKEGAMRTLSLTKWLYDSDGKKRLHYPDDKTTFSFRLFLGDENADSDQLPPANLYPYYVKDAEGNYCRWDKASQQFVSLGIRDHDELMDFFEANHWTNAQKETVIFPTSMNGAITKIPADYTVEVRELLVSTQYKVVELDEEIPKGYTLRLSDGYTRVEGSADNPTYVPNFNDQTGSCDPISGTIVADDDPALQVRNQKGWGLTVRKIWSDKDFMASHDDIYMAIYVKGEQGETLLGGSVRRLPPTKTELYYFFGNLQSGIAFENYVVREVMVTKRADSELVVDEGGVVSNYESVTPIAEGGTLTVGGTPVGGQHADDYAYTVHYEPGEQTDKNENVRVDTVANSRPGIALYKTDWEGASLSGATFTLQDEEGNDVAAESYTSADDGLITIAYLSPGTYTLTETAAPRGYVAMDVPMVITVNEDHTVEVSGPDSSAYTVVTEGGSQNVDMTATITIKDRAGALQVKKVDATSNEPLEGVHFALYRQVRATDGTLRKDYLPMTGYEDIVTDGNGILTEVGMGLAAGTYYLTETRAVEGYDLLEGDLCFTIGGNGTVSIGSEGHASWLRAVTDAATGQTSYVITIPNGLLKKVSVWKTDLDHNVITTGATFDLYRAEDYDDETGRPMDGAEPLLSGTTGENGLLDLGELGTGGYRLVETAAPAGYDPASSAIKISVTSSQVSALQSGNESEVARKDDESGYWVEGQDESTWQIRVWNNPGVALPACGGPGTVGIQALGMLLICLSVAGLVLKARRA